MQILVKKHYIVTYFASKDKINIFGEKISLSRWPYFYYTIYYFFQGTVSPCNSSDVNANDESNNEDLDLLTLGAETNITNNEDEVGMDYDNLMAYFDSLKESTA